MDRHDEKKGTTDEAASSSAGTREGDILGLSGYEAPKTSVDTSTEYDPESVAKRRARAAEEETSEGPLAEDPSIRGGGETPIDMGGGGQGTLIRGS